MTLDEALEVLRVLAEGVDPATGEVLADDSPCQNPQVTRALYTAIEELRVKQRRATATQGHPARAGAPWSPAEDAEIRKEFRSATKFEDIAVKHQRTKGAIVSRLVKLGEVHDKGRASAARTGS